MWFLAPLGLALFFGGLRAPGVTALQALLFGLLFGCITGAASTVWFLDTLPLTFLGIDTPWVQRVAVCMTWAYVAISLATPVPFGALVLWYFRHSPFFPLLAGVVWALVEVGRMWSFALTTYGPNSLFGPHFSAAAIGYTLTENNALLQLADPWGLDALNFSVAFVAGILAVIPNVWTSGWTRLASLGQGFAVVVLWLLCLPGKDEPKHSNEVTPLRFAIISENLDTVRDESTHSSVLDELTSAASVEPHSDVILLPEEFSLTSIFWSKDDYRKFVERYVGMRDVLIVNSRNELFPADEKNEFPESKKLVYDSTFNGELGRYTKQMLMPLGEYAPSFTKTFFSVIPDEMLQSHINEVAVVSPTHSRVLSLGEFKGARLGGLLCSDLFSPYLYRSLARDHGAQVLINLANHFWFHGSRTLYWKTLQMARLHAVQNRLPFLLANNVAPSFALDASGKLISETRWGARGVMYVNLLVRGNSLDDGTRA